MKLERFKKQLTFKMFYGIFLCHFLAKVVNAFCYRKHRGYVRHIISAHRTGPYLCKFKRKCPLSFQDRGKLLAHIKDDHHHIAPGKYQYQYFYGCDTEM
jgi:hypothetical protein